MRSWVKTAWTGLRTLSGRFSREALKEGAPVGRQEDMQILSSDDARDRRRDPRTDATFSIRNLLRMRSERHECTLAVLGTADGLLMAGSREDYFAERAAAHASLHLTQAGTRIFEGPGASPGEHLTGVGFEVAGRPLFVAVLDRRAPDSRGDEVESLAERVRCILAEHWEQSVSKAA
jgi:hypothetical protein